MHREGGAAVLAGRAEPGSERGQVDAQADREAKQSRRGFCPIPEPGRERDEGAEQQAQQRLGA